MTEEPKVLILNHCICHHQFSFEKGDEEGDEDSFLEPMDENIMAHLLSRGDEEDDHVERPRSQEEEEEELQEGELEFETPGFFFFSFDFDVCVFFPDKLFCWFNRTPCRRGRQCASNPEK